MFLEQHEQQNSRGYMRSCRRRVKKQLTSSCTPVLTVKTAEITEAALRGQSWLLCFTSVWAHSSTFPGLTVVVLDLACGSSGCVVVVQTRPETCFYCFLFGNAGFHLHWLLERCCGASFCVSPLSFARGWSMPEYEGSP